MTKAPPSTAAVVSVAGAAARRVRGLEPVTYGMAVCGPAATCRCANSDNLALHKLLGIAAGASVLVCDAGGDGDHGYFGELMGLDARNRDIAGLVIDGAVRDGAGLAASGFPVFHRGSAAAPCVKETAPSVGQPIDVAGVPVAPGDMVVADCDAVVVVARAEWPDVEAGARALEAEEDELREALGRGERLGELLGLDFETGS